MSSESGEKQDKKKYAPRRPFPQHTLEEALKVAKAIQDKNAGKPWKPVYVAEALSISDTSTGFRDVTSSAFKYGLTQGTWNAGFISLTPLGISLTKPTDPRKEVKDKQEAVLKIELFKSVLDHYRDAKLPSPDDTYFKNMLEKEFQVPDEFVGDFVRILIENGKFASILHDVRGGLFVDFAEELPAVPEAPLPAEEGTVEEAPNGKTPVSAVPTLPSSKLPPKEEEIKPTVFISHSKNATIVDQLKTILEFGQFEYKIAEETETTAIPIPEKVFGLMRLCTCAIINISADEQEKRSDGAYNVNPNVLTEIGGAFLLYEKKVILLVDKRVQLPSNLQGLYRCEYEGDELAFSTYLKLQKALAEFRKP